MINEIIIGNLEESLNELLFKKNSKSILVITGNRSFKNSLAEKYFIKRSLKSKINIYRKTELNPTYNEVLKLLKQIKSVKYDIIVCYGGGSVIDFSKLISLYKDNLASFERNFLDTQNITSTIPLIAVPTTAGSGSESTKFAVLYKENIKYSIVNNHIIPRYAILDARSTFSLSSHQTASSGIDALCQAIESLWAKKKTEESERYALKALSLIYPKINNCYNGENQFRSEVLEGSNYSGKAINISRTTGPHALSYYLTCFHKISHGEAVAINFEPFIKMNFQSINDNVKTNLFQIFKVKSKNEFIKSISNLKSSLNLKSDISQVKNLNIEKYLSLINVERLENNPVNLNKADIRKIFFPDK